MICTLTARRLKPGGFEDFKAAFEGAVEGIPDEVNERWRNVYVCRDVTDEDVALSFGFFDGTLEELREIQSRYESETPSASAEGLVEDVLLDGSYEVVAEFTP
jgi:hypothetical protein